MNLQKRNANPFNAGLQEIIERITNLIMVERIYCVHRQDDESIGHELIILLSNKSTKVLAELTPTLNTVLAGYPNYRYRLFYAHQVKDGIKKGNLFLYDTCSADKLIYTDPSSDFNLYPDSLDIAVMLETAKRKFDNEIYKIHAFSEGADFYIEKGNYTHAAFMVHQYIELIFRAIEMFAMGKDKVTHSIRVHQKYVAPYLPDMGSLFKEQIEVEQKLMKQLDEAYLAVRYEQNYEINRDKILLVKEKGNLAIKMAYKHYKNTIDEFENKYLLQINKSEKDVALTEESNNNQTLDNIIQRMASVADIQRIYCFGTRTYSVERVGTLNIHENSGITYTHYDLLVIADDDQPLYSFQGNFNNDKSSHDSLMLLVHNEQFVKKALESQDLFFNTIVKDGQLAYLKEGQTTDLCITEQIEEQIDQHSLDTIKSTWFDRHWNAKGFIEGAVEIQDLECMPVKVFMLNQAMEQLCIGLIGVYLRYQPKRHTVNHLFDLCCSFLPFAEEIFPRSTAEDKEIFDTLCSAVNDLRYKGNLSISFEEMSMMEKRCEAFLEKADKSARKKMKALDLIFDIKCELNAKN